MAVMLLAVACLFLIPSKNVILKHVYVSANQNSVHRALSKSSLIKKWWPDTSAAISATDSRTIIIAEKEDSFILNAHAFNVIEVLIRHDKKQASGFVTIHGIKRDTSLITWQAAIPENANPFVRLQHYLWANSLKIKMSAITGKLRTFMQKDENAYNLVIQNTKVTDTFLVSIRQSLPQPPTTENYYALIKKLKEYIDANGARETGYPMLNINREDGSNYEVMVATPVNKILPDKDPVFFKRMVPGNILMAEVRGGMHTINEGVQQLGYFVAEQGLKSPALPFQTLVTDRLAEKDTSKWITRLYYPIY